MQSPCLFHRSPGSPGQPTAAVVTTAASAGGRRGAGGPLSQADGAGLPLCSWETMAIPCTFLSLGFSSEMEMRGAPSPA